MKTGIDVRLREITIADAPTFLRWFSDRDVIEHSLGLFQTLDNLGKVEAWLGDTVTDARGSVVGIERVDLGTLVGYAGFASISEHNRSSEYFILIGDKANWGLGIATEATKRMVKHGFAELNLHRISLTVSTTNSRAIAAYEKAGFAREGVMRDASLRNGEYRDKLMMSILATDRVA